MNKFIDYNSPEKEIIKEKFTTIPYMDVWISSIVEGYIYENIIKVDEEGYKEEYTDRYGKKEGEYKRWYSNGQLWVQLYYKERKLDGESKWWYDNGQLEFQKYYKEGKRDGEFKDWHENGQIEVQIYYKEGKLEGECKWWNEQGELISHKIYIGGEVVEDLLVVS